MNKIILESIIIFVIYFLLVNGLGYINHYLLGDFLLDNIPQAYNIADIFIHLPIFIVVLIYIKRVVGFNSILKTRIDTVDIIIIISLCLLFRFVEDPIFRYKEIFKIQDVNDYLVESNNHSFLTLNTFLLFFHVVILTPIVEELVFRGLILNSFLQSNKNQLLGILISSILFTLIHINIFSITSSLTSIITSFIFGIVLSIIFIRKGIFYAMLFHIIYNLIWFILTLFDYEYFKVEAFLNFNTIYWAIFILSLLILILSLNYFYIKKRPLN